MTGDTKKAMAGFKVVDKDLKGFNGFQYTVGQLSGVKGDVVVCHNGLHFCRVAADCLNYAEHLPRPWRFLSVTSKGKSSIYADKSATDALFVERELTIKEWVVEISRDAQRDKAYANSVLCFASSIADADTMEFAKKHGATQFCWALNCAANAGAIVAMKILKSWGDFSMHDLNRALWDAAEGGHTAAMRLMKSWGADDFNGALVRAACEDHIAVMRLAKSWGANDFNEALWNAAMGGHIAAMELAKSWGANGFNSALHFAKGSKHRNVAAAIKLLEAWVAVPK